MAKRKMKWLMKYANQMIELQTVVLKDSSTEEEISKAEEEIQKIVLTLKDKILYIDDYIQKELNKRRNMGLFDSKPKVFFDFDDTLFATTRRIVDLYNEKTNSNVSFEKNIDCYYMTNKELPKVDNYWINEAYSSAEILNTRLPEEPHMIETLNKIKDKFNVSVCTLCYGEEAAKRKKSVIEMTIPFCSYVPVDFEVFKNKSHIDMYGAAFVEDLVENLLSSNAELKILYKPKYNRYREFLSIEKEAVESGKVILCRNYDEIYKQLCNFELKKIKK